MHPLKGFGNNFNKLPSEEKLKTELDRIVLVCKKAITEHKIWPKYEKTVQRGLDQLQIIQQDPKAFFSQEEGRSSVFKMLRLLEDQLNSFMKNKGDNNYDSDR